MPCFLANIGRLLTDGCFRMRRHAEPPCSGFTLDPKTSTQSLKPYTVDAIPGMMFAGMVTAMMALMSSGASDRVLCMMTSMLSIISVVVVATVIVREAVIQESGPQSGL